MTDTIHTVTLTPQEQAAFESGRKIGWNEGIEAASRCAHNKACDYYDMNWLDAQDTAIEVSETIRALSMPAPAQAWRVKPLEWREGTRSFVSFFAEAMGLEYEVHVIPDLPVQWIEASMPEWHEASDIETAKAAAQSDYAARILAALIPDTERGA